MWIVNVLLVDILVVVIRPCLMRVNFTIIALIVVVKWTRIGMKAGTHNRKYEYISPEQRIGKKEQQRIKRRELHKTMRKVSPFFAWVQDNCGGYLSD